MISDEAAYIHWCIDHDDVAMVSLHLLVGKRAVNPLLEEVTARQVQTVALIATAVEKGSQTKTSAEEN